MPGRAPALRQTIVMGRSPRSSMRLNIRSSLQKDARAELQKEMVRHCPQRARSRTSSRLSFHDTADESIPKPSDNQLRMAARYSSEWEARNMQIVEATSDKSLRETAPGTARGVVGGHGEIDPVVGHDPLGRPCVVLGNRGMGDDVGIERALAHLNRQVLARCIGIGAFQNDFPARLAVEPSNGFGKVFGQARAVVADSDSGLTQLMIGPQVSLGALGALDDGTGVVEKDAALGGEFNCAAGPVEQTHAQLALERCNRVADRRLNDVTHLSRASEPTHLCDSDKVFELANLHSSQPRPKRRMYLSRYGHLYARGVSRPAVYHACKGVPFVFHGTCSRWPTVCPVAFCRGRYLTGTMSTDRASQSRLWCKCR